MFDTEINISEPLGRSDQWRRSSELLTCPEWRKYQIGPRSACSVGVHPSHLFKLALRLVSSAFCDSVADLGLKGRSVDADAWWTLVAIVIATVVKEQFSRPVDIGLD